MVPRRRRTRSAFFLVKIWFLWLNLRLTLPVAVNRKRFFEPLWDFILGTGRAEYPNRPPAATEKNKRSEPAPRFTHRAGSFWDAL